MWRQENLIGYKQPIPAIDTAKVTENLIAWIEAQSALTPAKWLLAHCEDGVVWGKISEGKLQLSSQLHQSTFTQLQSDTLSELRLFGEQAEVHLWRTPAGWRACRIEDQTGTGDSFDEFQRLWGVRIDLDKAQRLWGKQSNGKRDGFTLVVEPGLGIAQAVPLEIAEDAFARTGSDFDTYRPLVLTCRHYLTYDEETGEAQIAATRLVNLHVEPYSEFSKRRQS